MQNRNQLSAGHFGPEASDVGAYGGPGGAQPYAQEEAFQEESSGAAFWSALQVVLARKWMIIAITLLGIAVATVQTVRETPLYRATATMEVQRNEVQIMDGASNLMPNQTGDADFITTQISLMKSRSLGERVAETLGLVNDSRYVDENADRETRLRQAANFVSSRLSVAPQGRSRVLVATFVHTDPDEAARILNAVIDNFIQSNLERRYNTTAYAREFLQERLAAAKTSLEESERSLVDYARAQGILEVGGEGGSSLDADTTITLNSELAQAQSARITAQQRYLAARSNSGVAEVQQSEEMISLRGARAALVAEYQEKLGEFKPEFPEMQRLQSRIDSVDAEIQRARRDVVAGLQSDYQAALAREQSLQERVEELKGGLQDLRDRRIQYTILQRDVDTNRSQYEALLQRLKEVSVASGVGSSQVSVVDEARPPQWPFSPNLRRALSSAFMMSLALGIGAAFGLHYIDDTIKSPEDVRNKLGIATLGVIPKLEESDGQVISSLKDPKSAISEAYFSTRTALQFSTPNGVPKSILVTSTRASEGKSSTTVALAIVLAKSGKRVLIIDADMRKPAFQSGGANSIGLSGLLTNLDADVHDHIIYSDRPNLALLPSGTVPPNPAEILAGNRLAELLADAQESFDVVLVDAPPLLGFSDAPTLSTATEASILVVQSAHIRRPAAQRSVGRLIDARANLVGAILTKFDVKQAGYDYGYYYYSYGRGAYTYGNERLTDDSQERRKIDLFAAADDDQGSEPPAA